MLLGNDIQNLLGDFSEYFNSENYINLLPRHPNIITYNIILKKEVGV